MAEKTINYIKLPDGETYKIGGSGSGFNLFDTKVSDHVLEGQEALGWALQGTYVYKEAIVGSRFGYPDFYAKCLEEYENATSTETVNSVAVKVYSNGHKFYDIANKSAIDTFYNTYGIADFYGVDTENERILLPRNDKFIQLTSDTSKVNDCIEAGLPNITGTVKSGGRDGEWISGAFSHINSNTNGVSGRHDGGSDSNYSSGTAQLDASRSSSVYGKSSTVQPPSSLKLLYYCVGNTVSDTSWVDVLTQVQGGVKDLEDKTNEGIEALANASNALRTTQIANCVTEIPQRIKLELNNGTLTLKAGSELTYGDGRTINIENDISGTMGVNVTFNDLLVICEPDRDLFGIYVQGSNATSGTTPPPIATGTADYIWFDTNTNQMKISHDTQATWTEIPLPIGLVDVTPYTYKAIKQVFNGIGYIGSTVWVDKGVKGLIPNGRNADGTLNNIEYTKNKISIATFTGGYADTFWLRLSPTGTLPNHGILTRYNIRSFSNAPTPAVGKWYSVYVEDENMFYYSSNGGAYFKDSAVDLGVYSSNANNQITSLKPKLPFRAIDFSNKSEVDGWSMPSNKYINLTLGASGSSYTAPANGYFGSAISSTNGTKDKFFELINSTAGEISSSASLLAGWARACIPAKKGDTVTVYYGGTSLEIKQFRFIYAEGEK